MKYKELKLGDKININNSSLKAEVIYVKHYKGQTDLTLKLQSNFRLVCNFSSDSEINI